MKKIFLVMIVGILACGGYVYAAQNPENTAELSKQKVVLTPKEQRKQFKARQKQIRKLVKQYRKASAEQKPVIKAQLAQIVSNATDEGIAWSKERISAERANLDQWEKKVLEQEQNLDQVKSRRVDDILSGEAERRHKLAQKRWKQEMKDRKKYMK